MRRQPKKWAERWTIPSPDLEITMAEPVSIPAGGDVDYTYEIVPTHFTEGRWVQASEILPGLPEHVHHAVVYVRPPDSSWLRHAPVGKPFTAASLADPKDQQDAMWTDSDILLVYAPGSTPDNWPAGMAKYIPAGSDLVFQMHYTTNGKAGKDTTRVGTDFFEDATGKARADTAAYQRPFCDPAGRSGLPGGSARHAAERRAVAEFFPAHAPAREAV